MPLPNSTSGLKAASTSADFCENHRALGVSIEPYLTFPKLARSLGVSVHAVREAAAQGLVPFYWINGRRRARIGEVEAAIAATREGGRTNG